MTSFVEIEIFEYLCFTFFMLMTLSQLFHPSWRWKGSEMIIFRVPQDGASMNSSHHGVIPHILLAQIQQFERKELTKDFPLPHGVPCTPSLKV